MNFLVAFVVYFVFITIIDCQSHDKTWESYKKKFNKNYNIVSDGGKRDRIRKQVFIKRSQQIIEHNRDPSANYRREHSRFSDMPPGELKNFLGLNKSASASAQSKQTINSGLSHKNITTNIPSALDYRYDRCLPDVKNQGKCASSWAFSAITPVEFAYCKKKSNVSLVLSEQQLLDCDHGGYDNGCDGGWPVSAWEYLLNHGITRGSQYPYTNVVKNCKYSDSMRVTGVSLYNYVEPENVVDMQFALMRFGPISAVLAVTPSFVDYGDGVYDDNECDGKELNHAVVIVGWGNLNGVDYWIGRNSWGINWGEEGYFLIQRGVNKCGIESYAAYVQVD